MPRLELIFLHSASADGCNDQQLLPASIPLRFARRVGMIAQLPHRKSGVAVTGLHEPIAH